MDYKDPSTLKSLGDFIFIETIEEKNTSKIKIVHKEPFSLGRVVGDQEKYSKLQTGNEVIYITDNASLLGLGYPTNIYVVRYEDILSICLKKD